MNYWAAAPRRTESCWTNWDFHLFVYLLFNISLSTGPKSTPSGQKDGQMYSCCLLKDFFPFVQCRATGIADHILPSGDWLCRRYECTYHLQGRKANEVSLADGVIQSAPKKQECNERLKSRPTNRPTKRVQRKSQSFWIFTSSDLFSVYYFTFFGIKRYLKIRQSNSWKSWLIRICDFCVVFCLAWTSAWTVVGLVWSPSWLLFTPASQLESRTRWEFSSKIGSTCKVSLIYQDSHLAI